MTQADPVRVEIEVDGLDGEGRPSLELVEVYDEDIPVSHMAGFYSTVLPDGAEVVVDEIDGRPAVRASTSETRRTALAIAGSIAMGLVSRSELSDADMAALVAQIEMPERLRREGDR